MRISNKPFPLQPQQPASPVPLGVTGDGGPDYFATRTSTTSAPPPNDPDGSLAWLAPRLNYGGVVWQAMISGLASAFNRLKQAWFGAWAWLGSWTGFLGLQQVKETETVIPQTQRSELPLAVAQLANYCHHRISERELSEIAAHPQAESIAESSLKELAADDIYGVMDAVKKIVHGNKYSVGNEQRSLPNGNGFLRARGLVVSAAQPREASRFLSDCLEFLNQDLAEREL